MLRTMRAQRSVALLALGVILLAGDVGGAAAQSVPPSLFSAAAARGTVRVLVRLTEVTTPEGRLPHLAAVQAQRRRIATAQDDTVRALAGLPHRVLHRYRSIPVLALEVDGRALNTLAALARVVLSVEEDFADPPLLAQSVPLIAEGSAVAGGTDGTGQLVAILDTGVDPAHPFLAGKVVAEACFSGESSCPNGTAVQTGTGAGVPCTYAVSACRHGTHVAGIAAGRTTGLSGVAPGASILSIQVFSRFTGSMYCGGGEDPCALSWVSDQLAALEHVLSLHATYQIAAVNMSLGGGSFTSPCDGEVRKAAIDNLRSVGIATVVASGNNGFSNALAAPACISTAVSIGSTEDGSFGTTVDAVSDFTNSAAFLSLLAPGRWINSSIPGGGFLNFAGTSMAAPHVAGAWAVLKHGRPTAPVADILAALQATGKRVTDPRNGVVKARIRVDDALSALVAETRTKTYTVIPCRVVDTRAASGPILANAARSFRVAGNLSGQGGAPDCGVPLGVARGVYINLVAVNPSASGHATVHAYPSAVPLASTINFQSGQTIANGVLVPICPDDVLACPFDLTVTMGPAAADVVIDIVGYTAP